MSLRDSLSTRPLAARALVSVALVAVAAALAMAVANPGPVARPATVAARPGAAVLLDAVRAGQQLFAVGERGLVLRSADSAASWRQVPSPTSVTLTAVRFASPAHGWAAGHAGVILATADGGQHWRQQLDGRAAADSALQQARQAMADADAAQPAGHTAARSKAAAALAEAQRLVADGPDKPFFDLWFTDTRRGFAVGAYNLFMRTDNGGATWTAALDRLPNAKGKHLYAINGYGRHIFIAGEQGLLLRSSDGGASFEALDSPYAGSFFTLAVMPGGELVVAGLRGVAFRSSDQGSSWELLKGLPLQTWTASAVSSDGAVWLGNQAGQVYVSRDAGLRWSLVPAPAGQPAVPITGLLALGPDSALTTTLRGFGRVGRAPDPNK